MFSSLSIFFRFGLLNPFPYSLSDCECLQDLHQCLKTVNDDQSKEVYHYFFDVVGMKCIRKDIRKFCGKYDQWFQECLEPETEERNVIDFDFKL